MFRILSVARFCVGSLLCWIVGCLGAWKANANTLRPATVRKIRTLPHARMVWIPPGQFLMGTPTTQSPRLPDEIPRHIRITRGFWIWQTEVTQAQFARVTRLNPSSFKKKRCGIHCPVERVTWYEALLFANHMSRRHRLPPCYVCRSRKTGWRCWLHPRYRYQGAYPTCRGWRLPTEAEWEYAARAGSSAISASTLSKMAWFRNNSHERVHRVARKQPNAWNLYDMLGNVAEWVWDVYEEYVPTELVDPVGPSKGRDRVFRGGAWLMEAPFVRVSYRAGNRPYSRYDTVGFRLVRTGP